ncbi:MAG: class I SAM-dependent methyltransferase [Ilumatobacteraceae bacterium]
MSPVAESRSSIEDNSPGAAPRLLRDRMRDDLYGAIRDAVCGGWPASLVADPASKPMLDDIVFVRYDKALEFVVPWIRRFAPDPDTRIIDFGCGSGSSTAALATHYTQVIGLDIIEAEVQAARQRCQLMGVTNCEFEARSPDAILARCEAEPADVIVLHAVVEHLLEEEKLDYLRRLWAALEPGGHLFVVETPNRYAYFDGHTFGQPFFHLLPDEILRPLLERRPELRFSEALGEAFATGAATGFSAQRHRFGIGVGFHDFEVALDADLAEVLVGDGFDEEIIWFFPLDLNDHLLLTFWDRQPVAAPVGFARSVLSLAFQKPRDADDRARNRRTNDERGRAIIAEHSLGAQLEATERRLVACAQGATPDLAPAPARRTLAGAARRVLRTLGAALRRSR